MPTYDYVCAGCGHAFEHFQEMSAKKLRTCPKCKKPRLERQVGTGAGLIFKGSGFYITDYKKAGATPPASESAPKAESDAGSAPAKPAADAPAAKPAPAAAPAPKASGKAKGSKGA
jgi:putative FmdB family regulatory protein